MPPEMQRRNLDLLAKLNTADRERHPHHDALAARMEAYELAFRMQATVPGVIDLSGEDVRTLAMYGVGTPPCCRTLPCRGASAARIAGDHAR